MRYKTVNEIIEIIKLFEDAILPHEKWRHGEHLTMAMHYALHYDFDEALNKMRSGILKLNVFHGVITTNDRGYHETLTVIWTRAVFDYVKANPNKDLVEMANEIIKKFDKNYPLKFYSRELLFSVEARYGFVESDLFHPTAF
ncbi:MAG: hypothetical protein AAB336_05465 [Acidobacteriota bacterium]